MRHDTYMRSRALVFALFAGCDAVLDGSGMERACKLPAAGNDGQALAPSLTSGIAKQATEKALPDQALEPQRLKPHLEQYVAAAVNRCATQNQVQPGFLRSL